MAPPNEKHHPHRSFKTPDVNTFNNRSLSRRTILRGSGVAMAIPFLNAMVPAVSTAASREADKSPRRMLSIQTNQGILPQFFFPEAAGKDYELSPYLKRLEDFRDSVTVFSGVSHPDVSGGHPGEKVFLTAAPNPAAGGFKNSVSIDQLAAEHIGSFTRFPTLSLQVGRGTTGISFTRSGVIIPPERSPSSLYQRMFAQGNVDEVQARLDDLRRGRSMLDFVQESARGLNRTLSAGDRDRLDQYFTPSETSKAAYCRTKNGNAVPNQKSLHRSQMTLPTTMNSLPRRS